MFRYIELSKLRPHPQNPRKELGDLSELAESIKTRGIMQNLTVIPSENDEYYTILIGHRRAEAAKLAGVTTIPCNVVDEEMSEDEQVATMLLENIQRGDLTPYEQAKGFQLMIDLGNDINDITKKTGFSQTTIRHRIRMLDLDEQLLREKENSGATLQDYIHLEKIKNSETKNEVLKAIGTSDFQFKLTSALKQQELQEQKQRWIDYLTSQGCIDISDVDNKYLKYDVCRTVPLTDKPLNHNIDDLYPTDTSGNRFFSIPNNLYALYTITLYIELSSEVDEDDTDNEGSSLPRIEEPDYSEQIARLTEVKVVASTSRTNFVTKLYVPKKDDYKIIVSYMKSIMSQEWGAYLTYNDKQKLKSYVDDNTCAEQFLLIYCHYLSQCEYTSLFSQYASKPTYIKDDKLLNYVEFLKKLGYQVAQEEQEYYDGTHKDYYHDTME